MAASGTKRPTRPRGSQTPPRSAPRREPAKRATAAPAAAEPGSGRSIWLAGLGALARAQAEGARHFQSLVKAGIDFDGQLRKTAGTRGKAAGALLEAAGGAFEQRMRSALPVVTRKEFDALASRVEALARSVEQLQHANAAPPAAARASGAAARRPVAHSVRRVRDELADVAKELENAQIAARDTSPRNTARKR